MTIAARYPTALQGIDPLVFDVTRSGAVNDSLDVSVTVSSGIISERKLRRTATIPAGEATGTLSVPTDDLASAAATGDVTATVEDGDEYDVGDSLSASVRLFVGDPLVTVRFSQESYSVDEGVGVVAGSRLIARTAPNVPAPHHAIEVVVGFKPGTATSPDDFASDPLLLSLSGGWTADGDTFMTSSTVPVTIVDDTDVEDDETLSMLLGRSPDLAGTVALVEADGSGTECPILAGCSATVTIRDDEPPSEGQELTSDDVIIEAVYPTAIAGLEDLVFDVTLGSVAEEDLQVPVTLSPGILSAVEQRLVVLILEGSTTTRLLVSTRMVMEGATTGDVTATVGDGDGHDVGEPSTATVRLHVGGGIVKVGFSAPVYRLDESVGTTTDQIRLTARTIPGAPVPRSLTVPVWTRDDTATSVDDYSGPSGTITFPAAWTAEDTPDGDVYSSEVPVPVSIVDDDVSEGDERLTLWVGFPTGSPHSVSLTSTDSAPECDSSGCGSYVIITDNDDDAIIADPDSSGDVTIEALHTTALQGIDDLVFIVTRSSASENGLDVPVTLSPGIIDEDRLSHTVTIPAHETQSVLRVATRTLDPNAVTGDVTATVGDGDTHDIGDPSSATTRVHVGETLVTVRFNAPSYALDEDVGTTADQIKLIVQTAPGVPIPLSRIVVSITSHADTAMSPGDYAVISEQVGLPRSSADWAFVPGGNAFVAEVSVALTVIDDDEIEDDETLMLGLQRAADTPATVALVTANPGSPCAGDCESQVTILDDDVDPAAAVVVTLVHVPDGTVIPDDSTVGVGATVVDGTTFSEDQRVYFRLLFEAADGALAPGGADVELSFEWTHHSPIVPISGQVSRIVLSLPRVDVWDSAVQILDNDIGNPDSTLTARITGCWRNGCIIGDPSEITVTIADDDGGPAAAPPGPPESPRLVCAAAGGSYDPTGVAVSWQVPSFVGGAVIEDYDVRYHRRYPDEHPWPWVWEPWPHTGTATTATITGLDADALYEVQVRAVNANGPGQWSLPNAFWTGNPDHICEILDDLAESQ